VRASSFALGAACSGEEWQQPTTMFNMKKSMTAAKPCLEQMRRTKPKEI
jgi:hypothetical protein